MAETGGERKLRYARDGREQTEVSALILFLRGRRRGTISCTALKGLGVLSLWLGLLEL